MASTIVVDFETYFDSEYSLTKLPTQAYILDKRFETIGVGIQIDDGKPYYVEGPDVAKAIREIDWDGALVLAHNAIFDGTILEWIYKVKPHEYFCTMQAARPFVAPRTGSASLKKCAEYYSLAAKGDALTATKGRRYAQFTPTERTAMADYCKHDVWLCYQLYSRLHPMFPPTELKLIDLTIKKHTRPKMMLHGKRIEDAIDKEEKRRMSLLRTIDPDPVKASSVLMSNHKFAELLRKHGVAPPMKESPATGAPTFAFAKKDPEFLALQEHENPDVQALVAARLGTKSTLEKTRLEKFRLIAERSNTIGVPLLYYGAGTGRFSGMDGLNFQNLSKKSELRNVLIAPPGHKIVTADLSQIEARLVATLAGQRDLVEQFRYGEDVYSIFATRLYGHKVTAESHPDKRFVGKCAILQLGYQAGAAKFYDSMISFGASITKDDAIDVVRTYRNSFQKIQELWRLLQMAGISALISEVHNKFRMGPVLISKECITLPNSMPIMYPNACIDSKLGSAIYTSARGKGKPFISKLYGGMLLENICQALARIVLSTAEYRLSTRGLNAVMSVHDELVFVVRDEQVSAVSSALRAVLTHPVDWLPELPLACTIGVGDSYKEAK